MRVFGREGSLNDQAGEMYMAEQRYAWSVPAVLLLGVVGSLLLHVPVYVGLCIGLGGSVVYALPRHGLRTIGAVALRGLLTMWQVCMVLLLIGAVLSLWTQIGTIPLLVHTASHYIANANLVWLAFVFTSLLSMMIGSSIATWGIMAPPLMAIAAPHLAPLVAGAIVSGGMVGDRSSPMSTSVLVMSKATTVPYRESLRQMNRTMILPWVIALVLFAGIGFMLAEHAVPLAVTALVSRNERLAGSGAGSSAVTTAGDWVLLVPPLLVISLAFLRMRLIWNLLTGIVVALLLAHWFGPISIPAIWSGAVLPHHPLQHRIGGIAPMLNLCILIVSAGAFQGVTQLGGAIDQVVATLFRRLHTPLALTLGSYGLSIGFALIMGSQSLAILMTGNALLPRLLEKGGTREQVLQIVGDAAELTAAIIPWSLLGLQAGILLGMPTQEIAPYAWFILIMVVWSAMQSWRKFRSL